MICSMVGISKFELLGYQGMGVVYFGDNIHGGRG
jgi:hypothetical protein